MLKLAETKKTLWQEISESGDLLYCFNCNTCISGCPASEADPPLLIRDLVRKVVFGLEDELLDDDFDLSPVDPAGGIDLVDREFGAPGQAGAVGSETAGEVGDDPNLDGFI